MNFLETPGFTGRFLSIVARGGQNRNPFGIRSAFFPPLNCFIILPNDCAGLQAGDMVDVQPFEGLI